MRIAVQATGVGMQGEMLVFGVVLLALGVLVMIGSIVVYRRRKRAMDRVMREARLDEQLNHETSMRTTQSSAAWPRSGTGNSDLRRRHVFQRSDAGLVPVQMIDDRAIDLPPWILDQQVANDRGSRRETIDDDIFDFADD